MHVFPMYPSPTTTSLSSFVGADPSQPSANSMLLLLLFGVSVFVAMLFDIFLFVAQVCVSPNY